MKKQKERWIWLCCFDDWSWSDGERCYAGSRKPVDSKQKAEQGLAQHRNRFPFHDGKQKGEIRKLNAKEKW